MDDEPLTADERAEVIKTAMFELDGDNAELWTKDGRPSVPALVAATKLDDITAAERDALWAELQAERPHDAPPADDDTGTGDEATGDDAGISDEARLTTRPRPTSHD